MLISIIIPTYNGANKIINCLKAIEGQSCNAYEVIVIIDGSTDNTHYQIKRQKFNIHNLKIVEQNNGGRAIARNSGARIAKGNILIFFDDDTRPNKNCVNEHLNFHINNSNSILVGHVPEQISLLKTDFQLFKAYLNEKWTAPLSKNNGILSTPFITAANFSIPKSLFFKLEMFDERLKDAEDLDLALRANEMKIPIFFNPKALAWHDDFITCKSYIKRLRQYHEAHRVLYHLKPNLTKSFKRNNHNNFLKKVVFNIASNKLWVYLIDYFNIFVIFPKSLRYKLYDIIVTGLSKHYIKRRI